MVITSWRRLDALWMRLGLWVVGYYASVMTPDQIASLAAVLAGLAILVSINANGIARKALRVQEKALPPVWSEWRRGEHSVYSTVNQSSRHILVLSLEPLPEGALRRFNHSDLPVRVEYGDLLRLGIGMGMSDNNPTAVRIGWRFEDEKRQRVTDRLL